MMDTENLEARSAATKKGIRDRSAGVKAIVMEAKTLLAEIEWELTTTSWLMTDDEYEYRKLKQDELEKFIKKCEDTVWASIRLAADFPLDKVSKHVPKDVALWAYEATQNARVPARAE